MLHERDPHPAMDQSMRSVLEADFLSTLNEIIVIEFAAVIVRLVQSR